ncbi:MAG: GspH/FimT family pseudopilin [Hahellaceae bacterium]|nr:GspH/FimT family pseudopilin [Hahellaceae bacterium]MCP5210635.1 GspH/FimT family pseudopilin [Hahellaceae bacterium]
MKEKGFTIIELMIAVTVLGVLAALAAPSFSYLIANGRHQASINALIGAVNLARVEAVKRGGQVTLGSISGDTAWTGGYRVWVDSNADNSLSTGEEVIRQYDPAKGELTLVGDVSFISFRATGFATAASAVNVCSGNENVTGRSIGVSISGRVAKLDYTCP